VRNVTILLCLRVIPFIFLLVSYSILGERHGFFSSLFLLSSLLSVDCSHLRCHSQFASVSGDFFFTRPFLDGAKKSA